MDVLKKITATLKGKLGINDQVFLFGSRARGTANADSDWDILILLDKDKVHTEDYDKVSYPLTYLGWDIDQKISPVIYTQKEWLEQHCTPFFHNVNQDAIQLI